jgi:hypothetical protein
MVRLSATEEALLSSSFYWAARLSESAQIAIFDQVLARLDPAHTEQIRQLSKDQKLAIIREGHMDPQAAIEDTEIDVFDLTILKAHPEMKQALAGIPRAKKLALIDEKEPQRTQDTITTLFDAQVMVTVNPKTPQERAALAAGLKLVTPQQKLKIAQDAAKDPKNAAAIAQKELKVAIFDAKFLQAMPQGAGDLALLTDEQKIKILDDAQKDPAHAEAVALKETKLAIFDAKFLLGLPHGTEAEKKAAQAQLALLTEAQKLKIVDDALKDPAHATDAEKKIKLTLFDANFLKAMPHGTAAEKAEAKADLALLTDEQKLKIVDDMQKDPKNGAAIALKETKLALFDAKFLQVAPHNSDAEKAASKASLALLTEEQKLKIVDDAQKDPANAATIAGNETKLAIFDATILKDHPEMKAKLAAISDADKLRLIDEAEPQRTEDIKIALFNAAMQDMYAQHPDLKAKIDQIPRDKKLQLIDAIQAGLKQDPQLLDHVNQAMQDHPQAFNSAISSLIEDPNKKDRLIGLIAADQMQRRIVDMVGGPDSILGKIVNWICDFLLDGPLGGFIEGLFGKFAGSMGGLQSAAATTASGGGPTLQGASATFQIAHETVRGAVEDTASGKAYHLSGELDAAEKAELDHEPDVKYTYDRAANQTTITSANRNWALAAARKATNGPEIQSPAASIVPRARPGPPGPSARPVLH